MEGFEIDFVKYIVGFMAGFEINIVRWVILKPTNIFHGQ